MNGVTCSEDEHLLWTKIMQDKKERKNEKKVNKFIDNK